MTEPTQAPRRAGPSLRAVPLWATLVAAVLSIAAVGLVIMGVAGTTVLERYLVDRVDKELQSFAGPLSQRVTDVQRGFGGPVAGQVQVPGAYYAAILAPNGTLASETRLPLRGNSSPPSLPTISTARAAELAGEPFSVRPLSGDGSSWRVLVEPLSNGGGTVVVAASLDDVDQTVSRLGAIDVVVGLIVLGLLAVASYLVVRVSLRPLAEVEKTAAAIAGGDLSRRLPDAPVGTEVGRLTESLNTMLTQIETAFRARERSEAAALASEERMRRFVADASHELRTPLTSIRGFAELYRQGAAIDDADVARMMRRIEDESVRMGLLVEDLLMLARLDEARPIERAEVDLLAIAADAVADLTALDPGRQVSLERVPPDGPRPLVIGDDGRLRQVVANLTSNAVAHTPAGTPVTVRVGTTTGDDGALRAVVEVADEGPGLTDEQRARVFERFYRAEPSRARTPVGRTVSGAPLAGTGLGLSIVAALVAAHEGQVEVESEPGHGATFRVVLPLAPDATGAAVPPQARG